MIELPDVTLLALTGVGYKTKEHQHALKESCKEINFGAVRLAEIPSIVDIETWNEYVVYELWRYVDTSHCILVHNDGYIINPEKWKDEWLQYDWASSPWPLPTDNFSYRDINGKIQRVGNSVSLRSRKLLQLPSQLQLEWKPFFGNTNEDGKFCVEWRHIMEAHGMKYMPFEEAIYFGKEAPLPENEGIDTFLFHTFG